AAFAAATPLDSYLDDMKTWRAKFLQTLADAHGREIDRSTGTLIVARPGKFSWEIHPQASGAGAAAGAAAGPGGAGGAGPGGARGAGGTAPAGGTGAGGQLMVADGRNLWFLDR